MEHFVQNNIITCLLEYEYTPPSSKINMMPKMRVIELHFMCSTTYLQNLFIIQYALEHFYHLIIPRCV